MKNFKQFFLFFIIAIIIININPVRANSIAVNNSSELGDYLIVKLKDKKGVAKVKSAVSGSYKGSVNSPKLQINEITLNKSSSKYLQIKLPEKNLEKIQDLIGNLESLPDVEYAEPIYKVHINWTEVNGKAYPSDFDTPTDPLNHKHWYLERIGMPEVWKKQNCLTSPATCLDSTQNIVIAIIDTGLTVEGTQSNPLNVKFSYTNSCDGSECTLPISEEGVLNFDLNFVKSDEIPDEIIWTNPDESNTIYCNDIHGVDIDIHVYNEYHNVNSSCTEDNRKKEGIPADDFGHGTMVAHIIASQVNQGSTVNPIGITPKIKIMPIKVNVPFSNYFYTDRLAEAIVYAVDNGADIINISAGTLADTNLVRDAVNYANNHNVIIVASTGNAGRDSLDYPAAYTYEYSNVIAAGATSNDLSRAPYSNYDSKSTIYAPVGDGSAVNEFVLTRTPSCHMNNSCAPELNQNTNKYEKTYDTFTDTGAIGTSFAAPQISGMVAHFKTRRSSAASDLRNSMRIWTSNNIINVFKAKYYTYFAQSFYTQWKSQPALDDNLFSGVNYTLASEEELVKGLSQDWHPTHELMATLMYRPQIDRLYDSSNNIFVQEIINHDNHSNRYGYYLGDWDYGYWKTECSLTSTVSGVSSDSNGKFKALYCQSMDIDKIAVSFEYVKISPWNGDDRRTYASNDWSYGYWKAECKDNEVVVGASIKSGTRFLHGLLCAKYEIVPENHNILFFNHKDNRLVNNTGDWAPGNLKAECRDNQGVSGVSHYRRGNKYTDAILCKDLDDDPIFENTYNSYIWTHGDNRGSSLGGDWDYGYIKLQCADDEIASGLGTYWRSPNIRSVLCKKTQTNKVQLLNNVNTYDYSNHDSRGNTSTGDWNWGNIKGECASDEVLVGVSVDWRTGFPHKILCRKFNIID